MTDIGLPQLGDRGERLRSAVGQFGVPNVLATKLNTEFSRQYPDEGIAGKALGVTATIGKGTIDAGLGLARGAQWLADLAQPGPLKSENLIGKIPTDLKDVLPQEQALRLESRLSQTPARRAVEVGGAILPLVASGGAGIVGKVAGAPGTVIGKLGAPMAKLGEAIIANAPKVGMWAKVAQALPATLGTSSGFGLYNFITTDGTLEQRATSLLHGAAAGAAIGVVGKVAESIEKSMLSKLVPMRDKRAMKAVLDEIKAGKLEPSMLLRASTKATDVGINTLVNVTGAAIEATGFSMLDRQFWIDAIAGVQGDTKAMERALETYAGTLAGVLFAKTGRPDAVRTFRREMPEMNTLETRLIAEGIRQPPERKMLPDPPSGPQGPQGSTEPSNKAAWRLPALNQATNPLFKSGWDLRPGVTQEGGKVGIEMQFPGSGTIKMWENEGQTGPAGEAYEMEVPVDVFRTVRGNIEVPDGTENIRMVGKVAEEFTRDLAVVSMLRRIRGELLYGAGGEAWAGGPWRGEDGLYHSIGLDNKPYTQGLFAEDGYTKSESTPALPPENGSRENPQIARWLELAQDLRDNAQQTPGLDLLEGSLMLAVRGSPQSRSVIELTRLLAEEWQPGSGVMNADLIAEHLSPDNIDQFAITVGQVAAGHLTAEQAAMQIGTVLVGSAKGTQITGPEGVAPKQPKPAKQFATEPNYTKDDMRRDWWREKATEFEGDVEVKVGANMARQMLEWFPKNSSTYKQISNLDAGGVITVPAKEARKFVDYYARRADRKRGEKGQSSIQAVDSFVEKLIEAHGLPVQPPTGDMVRGVDYQQSGEPSGVPYQGDIGGEAAQVSGPPEGTVAGQRDWFGDATPKERREAARSYARENPEATAGMLRDTFGVPRETARDILGEVKQGREGEAGFFRPGDILASMSDAGEAVGKAIKGVYDYAIPTTASLIAKQGGEAGAEFGSAMREIQSRTRAIIGKTGPAAESALSPKMTKKQKLARVGARFRQNLARIEMRKAAAGKMSEPRWIGLIEGRIKPEDSFEAQFAENGRKALLELKQAARGAGMLMSRPGKEGDIYFEVPNTDAVTVPRVYDLYSRNNFMDLMGNQGARKAFFDALAKLNPEVGKSGADLEEQWLKSRSIDKRLSDAERESALEHVRTYDNVPATFTHNKVRYRVLEADPAVAIMSIINRQASRIAAVDVVGQDLPKKVQEAFGRTKPGMSKFLADTTKRVAAVSQELVPIMEKLSQRVQAGEPEMLPRSARAYATATAVRRSLMASMSWAYDIPAVGVEPVVAIGLQRTMSAAAEVIRELGSNTKFAEEFGTLAVEMAHLDMGMARNPLERMAEIISTPGKITEEIKTVFFTRAADFYVRTLMNGGAKTNDRAYLEGVVKLQPAEAASILDGTAPDTLRDRVVREVVQVWTARGRPSERSRAASSPIVRLLVDFTGYATRRAEQIVAETVTFSKVLARPSSTIGERSDALNRLLKRYVGMAPAGIISGIIGAIIVDLLSDTRSIITGDEARIPGERIVRQLVNYPAKTLYKASLQQLASGPIAQFVDTLTGQNENPERILAPLTQIGAFGKGVNRAFSGHTPWETIRRFAEEAGFWPTWMTRTVGSLFMSAADKRYEVARSTVAEWERMEGLQKTYGERQKDASFYTSMSDVAKTIRDHAADSPQDVWDKIEPMVMKALEVDTREAVVNRLRGMRLLAGKTPEQLSKLQDYMGSDRYRSAVANDMLLSETARFVSSIDNKGKMPEWSQSLATAAKLAKDGTPNVFDKLMERAVDDMASSRISGAPMSTDIDELALTMAGYPEALQTEASFSDNQKKLLGRIKGDQERVHRLIVSFLQQRSVSRMRNELRDAAKKDK